MGSWDRIGETNRAARARPKTARDRWRNAGWIAAATLAAAAFWIAMGAGAVRHLRALLGL